MAYEKIRSEEISHLMQIYSRSEEDVGEDDNHDGNDGRSYRFGWKAMPLARDDLDSNYSHY